MYTFTSTTKTIPTYMNSYFLTLTLVQKSVTPWMKKSKESYLKGLTNRMAFLMGSAYDNPMFSSRLNCLDFYWNIRRWKIQHFRQVTTTSAKLIKRCTIKVQAYLARNTEIFRVISLPFLRAIMRVFCIIFSVASSNMLQHWAVESLIYVCKIHHLKTFRNWPQKCMYV